MFFHMQVSTGIYQRSQLAFDTFFQKVKDLYLEFDVMNNNLKLKYLMSEMLVKNTSEYIYCCNCKRRDFIDK